MKLALALMVLCIPGALSAQTLSEGRFELGGGVLWLGGAGFGQVDAVEKVFGGGTRPVFSSRSELEPSRGVAGRIALRLTPALQVESSVAFNAPRLATRISGDVEGVADTTVSEPVQQYLVEGGLLARLARWHAGRAEPFASAGIGYLRQLHDGRTVVETGTAYYVGGGVRYVMSASGRRGLPATGIRTEVRAMVLKDGIALDRASHVVPSVAASFFLRF